VYDGPPTIQFKFKVGEDGIVQRAAVTGIWGEGAEVGPAKDGVEEYLMKV